MKQIITIQHTQSEHHINGMVGSWTDWSLTDKGIADARRIADNLAHELKGNSSVALYSSDLKRCQMLAQILSDQLNIKVRFVPELRERNLGKACGQSVDWLKSHLECPEKTIDDKLFSDAESKRDVWERLKPFFNEVMSSSEGTIILVSHGDLLSIFNTMFLGLEVNNLNQFELFGYPGGVSYFYYNSDGKAIMKCLSDLSYMMEMKK